jgi:hypothetical protein
VRSAIVIDKILSMESPQLAVLNGDLITGENTFRENSSQYLDKVVQPLVQHDTPWASTYGNHDSDFNLSRPSILAREQRYRQSRTQNMVSSADAGVTNYFLPIYSSRIHKWTRGNDPIFLLWFFDSRGGNKFQKLDAEGNHVPQPNWVDESVSCLFHSPAFVHDCA